MRGAESKPSPPIALDEEHAALAYAAIVDVAVRYHDQKKNIKNGAAKERSLSSEGERGKGRRSSRGQGGADGVAATLD